MSSKEIRPRFYSCYLISCEHKQPGVGPAPCPVQPPIHWQGFQNGNVDFLFRSGFSIIRHHPSPSPGASNRGASSPRLSRGFPVRSLYSPPSHLAGNPTSSRQFHYPGALVAVCPDIGVALLLNGVLRLDTGGWATFASASLWARRRLCWVDDTGIILPTAVGPPDTGVMLRSTSGVIVHRCHEPFLWRITGGFSGRECSPSRREFG
jgi:hypothetical protein